MSIGFDASTYVYDAQSRLLSASKVGTTETFKYDGLNRQVSRTISAGSPVYNIYDGWGLIAEYASGSTSPSTAYLGGIKNLTANRYYYQDASGSTSHLADSTGQLLEWYRYDLQGTPIFSGGGNSSAFGVRHLFTGQQWYSEIGLYDLRNRFYSPDIGRFLQGDPLGFGGDATNLYRYCGNNPVKWSDSNGLLSDAGPGFNVYDFRTLGMPAHFAGTGTDWALAGGSLFLLTPFGFYGAGYITIESAVLLDAGAVAVEKATFDLTQGGEPQLEMPPRGSSQVPLSEMEIFLTDQVGPDSGYDSSSNMGDTTSFSQLPSWVQAGLAYGSALQSLFPYGGFQAGPGNAMSFNVGYNSGARMGMGSGTSLNAALIGAGHAYSAEVNGSIEMGGWAVSPQGMRGIGGTEYVCWDPPPRGPTMTWVQAAPRYATGWKWVKDPWKSYGYALARGSWVPTGWTTDPALAVTAPTLTPSGKPIVRNHWGR